MARQIRPENAPEVKARSYKIDLPDWSNIDKLGDMQIKAANENFLLYAETLVSTESAKLYDQFQNDPINLANALAKLPDMLKGLPEEIQAQMNKKMYLNGVSLVRKAQNNLIVLQNKETKLNALKLADSTGKSIANDYFNLLTYYTAPDNEKREIDVETYVQNRLSLSNLAKLTDSNGDYVFSEKQRKALEMPSDAIMAGFKEFIYRPDLKQLEEWDKNVFQNREKFIKDTGIDADIYDSMEKALVARIKQLKDDDVRQVHGQAFHDSAVLIAEPTLENIQIAKDSKIIPSKTIDNIVKASKEATASTYYYDPLKKTNPGAFFESLSALSELTNSNDWSIDGREKVIGKAAETLLKLSALGSTTNMSPEAMDKVKASIYKTITDKEAAESLDFVQSMLQDIVPYDENGIDYFKTGQLLLQKEGFDKYKKLAYDNFELRIAEAMDSYIKGDYETFRAQVNDAHTLYKIDLIGFMPFTRTQWAEWEKDVENGKDVILEYMGNSYKFNGFNAAKPLTLINYI